MNKPIHFAVIKSGVTGAHEKIYNNDGNKIELHEFGILLHIGDGTTLIPWHRVLQVYGRRSMIVSGLKDDPDA